MPVVLPAIRILPVLPPFEIMEAKLSAEPSLRNRVGSTAASEPKRLRNCAARTSCPMLGSWGFIGKGSKQRSVALPERARAVIRQYVAATVGERHDPLIRKEDGSRAAVTYMIVYRCVLRWAQRHLGVRLTSHKLRHAYGKNCVDLGADIRVISEALGHESLDSTRIYAQVSFERTRALAALFDSPRGQDNRG